MTFEGERLAKVMAAHGVASRRVAEDMIRDGRVRVNDQLQTSPAINVLPHDRIEVDGQLLSTAPKLRVWRMYKPCGVLTTERDPDQRPIVYDLLPRDIPRVVYVGRLDMDTEGLLLFTNRPAFAHYLTSPQNAIPRTYEVRVGGHIDPQKLKAVAEAGWQLDGIQYQPARVSRLRRGDGPYQWLEVVVREGKNHEVRNLMQYLGLTVERLIRSEFGPFSLDGLKSEQVREVPAAFLVHHFAEHIHADH